MEVFMETSNLSFAASPTPPGRTSAPQAGFALTAPTPGPTPTPGPQLAAPTGQLVAQNVQVTGPATENLLNVIAPAATIVGVKLQLADDADFPGLGRVEGGTAMLGALIIPNRVIVGDVAGRLAQGDVAGALAASPDLLTESSLFLSVPNPRGPLGLPGSDNRSAASVITIPLNGSAPQFGAAAPNTIPLPGGGLAFNNMRASGDGTTAGVVNAGVVVPVPGGRAAGGAIASALSRAAGSNNNPGAPATLADDAFVAVIGRSLSENTQLYLGGGFAGNLRQGPDGQLSITALNTTATVDPDRLGGQFGDWLRGRSGLPGSGGDDGSFPVASYGTGAAIEGLGALFALRGGTLTAAPYAAGFALRAPGAVDSALVDLAVANGVHKVDTAMLVNDVRNGANVNGSTAVGLA
jgi:hypothetical protein